MRGLNRAARLAAQISLLLALMSTSAYMLTRVYLDDDERIYNEGNINEMATSGGPVTIGHVEWKLDSLQPYTRIVDKKGEEIGMGGTAGTILMIAKLTATPRQGVYLKDGGFTCGADLWDDRGNVWQPGPNTSDWELPTNCYADDSDDDGKDEKFEIDKPRQVAMIYVIPADAASHVIGVSMQDRDGFRRVLIAP
ncbi:hypothetical protein ACIBL3_03005 [Kribbella sp. NPDC050124]|uniref:hypothetical protein n=1 Tax=Kribbella sp. NPDC050124 TaxID=3364114 RepID=UPI00378E8B93